MRLLDVQELDARLDKLNHRRKTLAEHADLVRLDGELSTLRDRIVAAETQESDVSREQSKFEGDIDQVRLRMQRDQQRLDGGAITSAKELESLQHEVISLQRRTSDLEDAELEVMERLDEIQQRLRQLVADRERVLAERESTTLRRDESTAAIDAEIAELDGQRVEVASDLPADLLGLYEKLRASNAGIGAALIQHRRCQGCRLELNATDIGRLRDAADDEVLRCDECGRILIRTADSGL